jgi:acetyl/propionyl-CoA carboxylase alpha subunit
MKRALSEYEIEGIRTSIPFLIRVFEQQEFVDGTINTHFIEEHSENLFSQNPELAEPAAMAAVIQHIETKNSVSRNSTTSPIKIQKWKLINRNSNLG